MGGGHGLCRVGKGLYGGLAAWAGAGLASALTRVGLARAWAGLPEVGVAGQKEAGRPPGPLMQVNPTPSQIATAQPNRADPPIPRQPSPRNLAPLPRQPTLTQSRPHQLMLASPCSPAYAARFASVQPILVQPTPAGWNGQ